jgi:LPXTG-motif cell wall-anchored protein
MGGSGGGTDVSASSSSSLGSRTSFGTIQFAPANINFAGTGSSSMTWLLVAGGAILALFLFLKR